MSTSASPTRAGSGSTSPMDISQIEEETFAEGIMFDGSSIAGWKVINESDMKLMPDPNTATIDPFYSHTTLSIVCDVLEPLTDEPYSRDPRSIAKKAEAYLQPDQDRRHRHVRPGGRVLRLRRRPLRGDALQHRLQDRRYRAAHQFRHRIRDAAISAIASAPRGGYFPVPPLDSLQDMRSEMLSAMASMGVKVEKHHHEVASAQHELGMKFDTLVTHGRPHAGLQILHPQRRQRLRQDGDLHAEADLRRQRLRHARAPVDLEERQAALRRQALFRPFGGVPLSTSAASSSMPAR